MSRTFLLERFKGLQDIMTSQGYDEDCLCVPQRRLSVGRAEPYFLYNVINVPNRMGKLKFLLKHLKGHRGQACSYQDTFSIPGSGREMCRFVKHVVLAHSVSVSPEFGPTGAPSSFFELRQHMSKSAIPLFSSQK